MMLVNPLLDTVLVQATAKGVGTTLSEKSPFKIPPVQPSDEIHELRSDSRLNDSASKQAKAITAYQGNRLTTVNSSTVTTLNEAARTIADVLNKFPAGLISALRLSPLLNVQLLTPGALAKHIKSKVVSSGLFYESHVLKWSKGEFPLDQLWLEPQFNGHKLTEGEESLFSQPFGQRLVSAQERQQYMIRHQLELLGNPNIRMEGELAPGYPMTILFQRVYDIFYTYPESPLNKRGDKRIIWSCLLRLEHPSFSYVDFDLQLCGKELNIMIIGCSALIQEYFRRDEDHFRNSFATYGVDSVNFSRKLISRLEGMSPLKFSLQNTKNADAKRSQTAFEHEYGQQAERVIPHAADKNVPINMGPELLGILMQLDFDQSMPDALFAVCADISVWTADQVVYL